MSLDAVSKIQTREQLLYALYDAAELEHSICCQYLFTAFSLKTRPDEGLDAPDVERAREWKGQLLLIARQEMSHLSVVCNLLTAIGGVPHLERSNFPTRASRYSLDMRFELSPFSLETLNRFIHFERPSPETDASASNASSITLASLADPAVSYGSPSALYVKIAEGLKFLAAEGADPLFFNLTEGQISNESFSLPEGYVVHDMTFPRIKDLTSALKALEFIREQGEGHHAEGGHYSMLRTMREELKTRQRAPGRGFNPARPVLSNPRTVAQPGEASPRSMIERKEAREVAQLFNYAYETMLMMLARLYADAGRSTARFELMRDLVLKTLMTMVLRPMGELLTEMPATHDNRFMAGAPFEVGSRIALINNRGSAWSVFRERLRKLAKWSGELCRRDGVPIRMEYVHKNLERIANDVDAQHSSR